MAILFGVVIVAVRLGPSTVMRPVNSTSDGVYELGGTKKSVALVAFPDCVITEIGPVRTPTGAVTPRLVEVVVLIALTIALNRIVLSAAVGSKLVPVIVTAVPAVPTIGVKLDIAGGGWRALTTNDVPLVVEPVGVVTP